MEKELLKINILAITGAGILMVLTGLVLYYFRGDLAQHQRFFLPIPPLGVAAYIFVFNFFKSVDGNLPADADQTIRAVLVGTGTAALVFLVFSVMLIVGIGYGKRYF